MSSFASAPLNNPATLKQALGFMDRLDDSAPLSEAPETWEGRPEQWCALLDRLCREQGHPVAPETIARVVQLNPPLPPLGLVESPLPVGSFDIVGVTTPYQEHPEVPGWEMPPATLLDVHEMLPPTPLSPLLSWDDFVALRWEETLAKQKGLVPLAGIFMGVTGGLGTLFFQHLWSLPLITGIPGGMMALGAATFGALWGIIREGGRVKSKAEKELRQQWSVYQKERPTASPENPREHDLWMRVPHLAASANRLRPAPGEAWREVDLSTLHDLLVTEERRRARNLSRWRAHSTQRIVD